MNPIRLIGIVVIFIISAALGFLFVVYRLNTTNNVGDSRMDPLSFSSRIQFDQESYKKLFLGASADRYINENFAKMIGSVEYATLYHFCLKSNTNELVERKISNNKQN